MKKYIDDYEVVVQEDSRGREKRVAVYVGDYYEVKIDEISLQKFRRNSLILLALIVIGQIAAGFIANTGMYAFFVSLPYIFTFLPLYFLVDGALRLPKEKRPLRRDEAELIFKRMKTASKFLFPLLGAAILGEAVYLIWFSSGSLGQEFIFLAVEAVALAAVFVLLRIQKPIEVTQVTVEEIRVEEEN